MVSKRALTEVEEEEEWEESSESLRKVKGRSVSGTSFSIETEHWRE